MSNQKERPPAEVNLSVSYEDGGQSLLNKTDVEILAVEDAYHARLDRKGSGRMSASYLGSHGGGGGGGGDENNCGVLSTNTLVANVGSCG
mmetsp:Transcript_21632/g.46786  ORF Transcript_21632/g.46786 Transcript_21632/m.46786 type:complete len:90 (+) Transcript_21632:395-664(+)